MRLFIGKSAAENDVDIIADLVELWQKAFAEVLPWYPDTKWNSLQCALDCYEGSVDLTPQLNFVLLTSQPGCRVHFHNLEGCTQADFATDEEFEAVCLREEVRYVGLIQTAWKQARQIEKVVEFLQRGPLPCRIVNSPEEDVPPLVEMELA